MAKSKYVSKTRQKTSSKTKQLIPHRIGGNQKRNQQSMNTDQKLIEIVFLIAICRLLGDKWQSKNTVSIDFFTYVPR